MARGRGSSAARLRHAWVKRFDSMAFIGLPCPMNSAGSVPSRIGRAGSVLRVRVVGEAVEPALPRLRRGDDVVPARPGMLAGVPVRRAVAAPRTAALLAGPQVDPPRPDRDALLAFAALRVLDGLDRLQVRAG